MSQSLLNALKQAGKPAEIFQSSDASTVLILPHGGRVLGLFCAGEEENFYWTNPVLNDPESARAFFAGEGWHNSGGDRTWLAPEVDVFFPNYPKLDKYWQPRQLDPGQYILSREGASLKLTNRLSLALSRSAQKVELEMSKSFSPAPNPLRYEKDRLLPAGLSYAGYAQHTTLELLGEQAQEKGPLGLWNLVQMPHGGELLVGTCCRTEPHIVMGRIDAEDLLIGENSIRYRMRAAGEHKLSIRAVATTGRVGYLHESGGRWSLIVRNFFVDPSGEYVDSPWDESDWLGFAVQACNVKSGLGSFSELEYHIPAIGRGTGRCSCRDTSLVWAFRGERGPILEAAGILLGA